MAPSDPCAIKIVTCSLLETASGSKVPPTSPQNPRDTSKKTSRRPRSTKIMHVRKVLRNIGRHASSIFWASESARGLAPGRSKRVPGLY
eukprot:8287505-Pyramimonas_sp.AAC.1